MYSEGTAKWLKKQGFRREFRVSWSMRQSLHDRIRKIGEYMPINMPYILGWHSQATWEGQYVSQSLDAIAQKKAKKIQFKF